jgi:Family of unknown function (DUF6262)
MTSAPEAGPARRQPRPDKAIDARRRTAAAKVTAVEKAVKTLGRAGAPITRAGIAQLAGVSRSFTHENDTARKVITDAEARTQARVTDRVETMTAGQEASWRERALDGEDQIRTLRRELTTHRRLVADLMGQLRQPDGTWIEGDRNRLRDQNQQLTAGRDQLAKERNELQRRLDGAQSEHRPPQQPAGQRTISRQSRAAAAPSLSGGAWRWRTHPRLRGIDADRRIWSRPRSAAARGQQTAHRGSGHGFPVELTIVAPTRRYSAIRVACDLNRPHHPAKWVSSALTCR